MRKLLYLVPIIIGLAIVAGLYYSISIGMLNLTLKKSYIAKKSSELQFKTPLIAFTHVNVVPMDREVVLENQTVVVRQGVIEAMGDLGEVDLPEDALIIEGEGKYLMPGLVDMHVHIQEENELLLFVANGVTTVRNMWGNTGLIHLLGNADQLELREKINKGELFGPTIYTSGPILESPPSKNPFMKLIRSKEDARNVVTKLAGDGYDFIKVYDHLAPEIYAAILETAEEHTIPVVGHVPHEVGLDTVLQGGQSSIEHLTGYIDMDAAELIIPEDEVDHYVEKSREAGVWVVPTIVLHQYAISVDDIESVEKRPELKYISPRMMRVWRFFTKTLEDSRTYQGPDYPDQMVALATRMTSELHRGGVGILLGTDTDNGYLIPGLSLHEELQHLVNAGLSPYEAIKAGTRDAAEALGKLDEFGTVNMGKRADLILVERNPLEDAANVNQRVGVMLRGQWLPESQLQEMLGELAASYTPTLIERIWPLTLIALGIYLVVRRSRL